MSGGQEETPLEFKGWKFPSNEEVKQMDYETFYRVRIHALRLTKCTNEILNRRNIERSGNILQEILDKHGRIPQTDAHVKLEFDYWGVKCTFYHLYGKEFKAISFTNPEFVKTYIENHEVAVVSLHQHWFFITRENFPEKKTEISNMLASISTRNVQRILIDLALCDEISNDEVPQMIFPMHFPRVKLVCIHSSPRASYENPCKCTFEATRFPELKEIR